MAVTTKDREGHPIKVGDFVMWKDDIEESGRVRAISGFDVLSIVWWDDHNQEYREVVKPANRVWFEYEGIQ